MTEPNNQTPASESAEPKGFFGKLRSGLFKTRAQLATGLGNLILGEKEINEGALEDLEAALLMTDVGMETTQAIISDLTARAGRRELANMTALYEALNELLVKRLANVVKPLAIEPRQPEAMPKVVFFVGVNGVGFDAVQRAQARGVDVLLVDTAGRLQAKAQLMDELAKIQRVVKRLDPDAPHEVILVLDGGVGQNALSQVKLFNEAVPITGLVVTKLDGTAKAGVLFALASQSAELKDIPIYFIGVGEGIEDLRVFEPEPFVAALLQTTEAV